MSTLLRGTLLLRAARRPELVLALVGALGAAGGCARPDPPRRTTARPGGSERAPAPPLELVLVAPSIEGEAEAPEIRVRWTGHSLVRADDGGAVPSPRETSESDGLFAYAERRTTLHHDPRAEAEAVGHLDLGARVGVREIKGDWARVVLFAWRAADVDAPLEAWARSADLGARARRDAPPARSVDDGAPRVPAGEQLRTAGGRVIGRTFCGEVDVVRQREDGHLIAQSEDGVTLEGVLDRSRVGLSPACPPLVLLDKKVFRLEEGRARPRWERILRYHGRARRHRGPAPAALVPTKPFAGPTFADLARRGASLYWLVLDRENVVACSRWTIAGAERSGEGKLVSRSVLADGDTLVTTFGLQWSEEEQSVVMLEGPSSEVLAPPGRAPRRGGGLALCGRTLRVVASEGGALTVLAGEGAHGSNGRERVIAYEPRATERWYTDEKMCEADAHRARAAGRERAHLALGFSLGGGC